MPPIPPYIHGVHGPNFTWPEGTPESDLKPSRSSSTGKGPSATGGRKVDPTTGTRNNANHPGKPSGGGGSGGGSGGGNNEFDDGEDAKKQAELDKLLGRRSSNMLSYALFTSTIMAYAKYQTAINAVVATVGRCWRQP